VSPTVQTTYSVSVKDQNSCPGSASKVVKVMDISGGKNGDKIVVCHKGNTLTIGYDGVADHLGHSDMLGSCELNSGRITSANMMEEADLGIKVLGNPSSNYFDIRIGNNATNNTSLTVYDNFGRVIEIKTSLHSNQVVRLGNSYHTGIYLVQIVQGTQKQTLKLIKAN
jgi:hypothetical protein